MELTKPSIDQLLNGCRKNDQAAQCALYDRYYKAMYNTALRIVKDTAEAEDIMQDSFLSAFTKIESYKGEAPFGSWLKRIVVNNSIAAYRKNQKLAEEPLDHSLYKLEEKLPETSENQAELQVKQVVQAMNKLKENYRMCLNLHLIEGYDYEEVSQMLNISYANCRTMISRAKERLRKQLQESKIL